MKGKMTIAVYSSTGKNLIYEPKIETTGETVIEHLEKMKKEIEKKIDQYKELENSETLLDKIMEELADLQK